MSFKKGSEYDIDLRSLTWLNPEYRERQSKAHMGNEVTQETREKISKTMTGHIKSEEHCKNLSKSLSKRSLMNEEHRERVRQANRGKKQTADTIAKISESLKGKTGKRYVYKTPMGDFTSGPDAQKANNLSEDQLRRRCIDEWEGFSRIQLSTADTIANRSESLKGKAGGWAGKPYVYKTPMGDFTSVAKAKKANNLSDAQLRRRCVDEWDGFSRIQITKKT